MSFVVLVINVLVENLLNSALEKFSTFVNTSLRRFLANFAAKRLAKKPTITAEPAEPNATTSIISPCEIK